MFVQNGYNCKLFVGVSFYLSEENVPSFYNYRPI